MSTSLTDKIGLPAANDGDSGRFKTYINLKLAAIGCPMVGGGTETDTAFQSLAESLLAHNRETERLLADYLCPADWRIQQFLDEYLYETGNIPRLPGRTFVLDRHGLARALSLPADGDEFVSDILTSYRVKQGVLHNPAKDRRTTQGVFHVCEGGLPIPDDKKAVPQATFAALLQFALTPPRSLMRLPFTAGREGEAACWVTLLLRPLVCPAVEGFTPEKTMEVRFFAPGNLVSNLDFVESIFGNAGDPFLPQNDSGLDVEHWSGHTGCVILAPHLTTITKKAAGLPHWEKATERQRRDGMCWKHEGELYNDGSAFKVTARDGRGVIVTLIADNYFGYCKKEVKTQVSYAANLYGRAEEEHAGGALVFPSYDLGEVFDGQLHVRNRGHSFAEAAALFADIMDVRDGGYAVDKNFPDIVYVPEKVQVDLHKQAVTWATPDGEKHSLKLLPGQTYLRPSGYRLHMEKPPGDRAWRLIGTRAEATFCHKPSTVSGGGKSEISKSISDAIIQGPVFVSDFEADFDQVAALLAKDYSKRFRDPARHGEDQRPILSSKRSLGSVIKLLTPAPKDYSDDYNQWLAGIPQHVKELLFVVKRFYIPEWGEGWRAQFSVDSVNGVPGNELKLNNRKLVTNFLRVGFEGGGSWRVFSLRKDFHPAVKLQMEDDITASVVVPQAALTDAPAANPGATSLKFSQNCEYRLFQRPDDAIHPGYDKQTERDFSQPGNFFSNYQPLRRDDVRALVEDSISFVKYTLPMSQAILAAAEGGSPEFFVCSSRPRIVDGKQTKNPRYLQTRQDLLHPRDTYLAEICQRLNRKIPHGRPLHSPVHAILPGRRNNPAEDGVRPLAVFNPIHYLELPELFLEYICSLTGKSPSTTGAGSEGALTKGPFNALPPVIDLNAALVSLMLTNHPVFITAAGYVGPKVRVDHDVSLLVPEVWSRMGPEERDPRSLIDNDYIERVPDIEFNGRLLPSSRLGWRINRRFVRIFFGRVFNYPHRVFTDEMLQPEKQDIAQFADAMDNIITTQRRVAEAYFADGSIEMACPPLKALLHIMRDGTFEGRGLNDAAVREQFKPEVALQSDWYLARLQANAARDRALWVRHVKNLESFIGRPHNGEVVSRLHLRERLSAARDTLREISEPEQAERLRGTLGVQPL